MQFHIVAPLDDKELSILKMFSEGMLREEVAQVLKISPKTLRVYLTKIYSKLSVKKLHQAIVWFLVFRCKD